LCNTNAIWRCLQAVCSARWGALDSIGTWRSPEGTSTDDDYEDSNLHSFWPYRRAFKIATSGS
jgi:hypothetical protein